MSKHIKRAGLILVALTFIPLALVEAKDKTTPLLVAQKRCQRVLKTLKRPGLKLKDKHIKQLVQCGQKHTYDPKIPGMSKQRLKDERIAIALQAALRVRLPAVKKLEPAFKKAIKHHCAIRLKSEAPLTKRACGTMQVRQWHKFKQCHNINHSLQELVQSKQLSRNARIEITSFMASKWPNQSTKRFLRNFKTNDTILKKHTESLSDSIHTPTHHSDI